jgi:hypothetical protein
MPEFGALLGTVLGTMRPIANTSAGQQQLPPRSRVAVTSVRLSVQYARISIQYNILVVALIALGRCVCFVIYMCWLPQKTSTTPP